MGFRASIIIADPPLSEDAMGGVEKEGRCKPHE